jgi:hypothetical protein
MEGKLLDISTKLIESTRGRKNELITIMLSDVDDTTKLQQLKQKLLKFQVTSAETPSITKSSPLRLQVTGIDMDDADVWSAFSKYGTCFKTNGGVLYEDSRDVDDAFANREDIIKSLAPPSFEQLFDKLPHDPYMLESMTQMMQKIYSPILEQHKQFEQFGEIVRSTLSDAAKIDAITNLLI